MPPTLTRPRLVLHPLEELVASRGHTRLTHVVTMLHAAERGSTRYKRLKLIAYVVAYGGSLRSASKALKRAAY